VLCSFILSSPLFCFLTFIKSRPFSNYQVTVFIKIWIVNFEILNMKWPVLMWLRYNFSKEKSLSHRFTVTSLPVHQSTVISHQSTVISHLSQLISALGLVEFSIQWLWSIATNPSLELTETTHLSPLLAPLGLIKFSIQWFWSIATNPSLELTFKCGFDTIFQKKNHSATSSPLTTHHSQLTTHYYTS
jgi:hypothetical protein